MANAPSSSLAALLQRAISPQTVRPDGIYTMPRSFGVYYLPTASGATRRHRFGNHPIRQRELENEFGKCDLQHLFLSREDAKQVASLLNGWEEVRLA